MRIIAGEKRGRKLKTPKGDRIRPTEDRIKESIFNVLFGPFSDVNALDLFAGTGGIGIEFLSRGAAMVWFCDKHPDSLRLIRENLNLTGYNSKSRVFEGSYEQCLSEAADRGMRFDYIYLDPPYAERAYYSEAIRAVVASDLLKEQGRLILEAPREYEFEDVTGLRLARLKKYGNKKIWIYESCD
ncbi:Ribosomal RNA small subunit methyltransferase D [Aedoeadaptatus ivorii]|uniref:Ribosomal RNA small subunit methyltransferase D n=1 Tax=Aedoeadaptatus ivorii TaxID=54006 RepID=A0A3S5BW63_9FIRM|nr:16S rRNA (guanine(966)-N(2))-methyltransferase RsmD [Peptoniphilus ivorii]MDQ0507793.1 16S rRNA (guanine(966)-N(2))-methyltransferase RsmD [Peptoniphilus ivorii]VEJ35610.1 Ribosomal RNA small subunit methyltransferase D [Peptoniphilus ivorii]